MLRTDGCTAIVHIGAWVHRTVMLQHGSNFTMQVWSGKQTNWIKTFKRHLVKLGASFYALNRYKVKIKITERDLDVY